VRQSRQNKGRENYRDRIVEYGHLRAARGSKRKNIQKEMHEILQVWKQGDATVTRGLSDRRQSSNPHDLLQKAVTIDCRTASLNHH